VLNETLRLYPPLPFVIRQSLQGEMVAGERCPMGGVLTLSPWVLHRHRRHWNNPDAFDPERFLVDDERDAIRDAYMPFGLGARRCPGAPFAQQEALILLTHILAQYKMAPVKTEWPAFVGRLTLRSDSKVMVRVERRNHDK